jgi:hypothetical protein
MGFWLQARALLRRPLSRLRNGPARHNPDAALGKEPSGLAFYGPMPTSSPFLPIVAVCLADSHLLPAPRNLP